MRKDIIILFFVLIPATIFMLIVARNYSTQKSNISFSAISPYPTIQSSNKQIISAAYLTPTSSKNIEILSPLIGDSVKSGFMVKGNARTHENIVYIRLMDSIGNILIETSTTANASDIGRYGPFDKEIVFYSENSEGKLEVFQYSSKDGSEIDKVEIPLIFSK